MAGAMSDVDYTLGLTRGKVPRAVSVILLEGDLAMTNGDLSPNGVSSDKTFTRSAPITAGDLVKLNVLGSNESLATEGMIVVEKADAAGDFAVGMLQNVERMLRVFPDASVDADPATVGEITALLSNKYYRRGTVLLWCMTLEEVEIDITTNGAIIPGDAVAPSVGNPATGGEGGYRWIKSHAGLDVADNSMYDDNPVTAANDVLAAAIALHAGDADGDRIAVAIGLQTILLLA